MMMQGPLDRYLGAARSDRRVTRPRRWPQVAVLAAIAVLALVTPGIAHATRPQKGFDATLPKDETAAPSAGAIFNVNAGYAALVEGPRAHAVGDVLTITLVENLSTSKQAIGKTTKSGSFSVTPPTAGPFAINPNALNASGASAFNGEGDASQKSQLGGQISVTIAETRRNGTVLVKGTKRLLLSQGEEWVQISGIVRIADIDQNNTVQSGQVADAHVVYTGNGSIGRASRQGWLARFFSVINPF
jgi:flagellar L-ring protein precursor FlgH